jgi:hypothetical protein
MVYQSPVASSFINKFLIPFDYHFFAQINTKKLVLGCRKLKIKIWIWDPLHQQKAGMK